MPIIAAFALGLLFGLGILISGMSNPAKILNFFDFVGTWDPSLAFVMAGGLFVNFFGYRFAVARSKPLLTQAFELPAAKRVTTSMIAGAAVFGIGWGLSGFCPGGLVPVLAIGGRGPWLFLAGLIVGLMTARALTARQNAHPGRAQS